jgi:hypothetical protein
MTPDQNDSPDQLTAMLRRAATVHGTFPDPAAVVRLRAEHARYRRRTRAAGLGVVAAVAGAVVFQQVARPDGLFDTRVGPIAVQTPAPSATASGLAPALAGPQAGGPVAEGPARTPRATGSLVTGGTPASGDAATATTGPYSLDDEPRQKLPTWPAPPTAQVRLPWTRAGYDYGTVVAARMEDGHAVVTFDRQQLFTAEEWKAKTGETEMTDFHVVNESTRTRQFVVEPDALLYGNWLLTDFGHQATHKTYQTRYTPQELVTDINRVLVGQATSGGSETPSIGFFLFHRDTLDGPVAYAEEASAFTG